MVIERSGPSMTGQLLRKKLSFKELNKLHFKIRSEEIKLNQQFKKEELPNRSQNVYCLSNKL